MVSPLKQRMVLQNPTLLVNGLFSSCHISTICRICFESSQQLLCIKFEFFIIPDRVFKQCENTDHVYAAIAAPIVEGAMEGFNG